MRPRKVILYVSVSEKDQSVMKFMLETNRYQVFSASNIDQAASIFSETDVHLVLVDHEMGLGNGIQAIALLKELKPHVPMILLGDMRVMAGKEHIGYVIGDKTRMPARELLDRIKVMVARKRGPSMDYCIRRRGAAAQRKELEVRA